MSGGDAAEEEGGNEGRPEGHGGMHGFQNQDERVRGQ